MLGAAALLLLATMLARELSPGNRDELLGLMFVIPIALAGFELGTWGGVATGVAALVWVALRGAHSEPSFDAVGLAMRGVVFVGVGALAGRFSDRVRAHQAHQAAACSWSDGSSATSSTSSPRLSWRGCAAAHATASTSCASSPRPCALRCSKSWGLRPALERLCERDRGERSRPVELRFQDGGRRLPADVEISAYRVVADALSAVEPASALYVSVRTDAQSRRIDVEAQCSSKRERIEERLRTARARLEMTGGSLRSSLTANRLVLAGEIPLAPVGQP